ncbi:MAG: DUF6036 family nucleotidyltransferase [Bacteroidales bacterium]|nr:DUF6036 family nucleotidyltransferase [Bacteroidales bacterium]
MFAKHEITKENIDLYLQELAKEYERLTHRNGDAEIIIAGGGAIMINHNFRNSTQDIDAWIEAGSSMKDAILYVADKFDLPPDWINTDFSRTESFSGKLSEVSEYYRTFSNRVQIRVVPDEYLIAMKLVAGRDYKHDYSDIAGVIRDNAEQGTPLTRKQIEAAAKALYGTLGTISEKAWAFLDDAIENAESGQFYDERILMESENIELLTDFDEKYPHAVSQDNIESILEKLRDKENKDDI